MIWIALAHATPTAPITSGLTTDGARPDHEEIDRDGFERWSPADQAQIINGRRESLFGATVAIAFPGIGSICTASMITPRVALTAGHCVSGDIPPEAVRQFGEIRWGPNADNPTQVTGILRVIPHPNFSFNGQSLPQSDIAIIEIEPVPYTDTVWINEEDVADTRIGDSFFSVGYGLDNPLRQSGSGRKRSAEVTLDLIQGDFLYSDTNTNPRGAGICSGDSGGPMYGYNEDGLLREFAVHSFGVSPDCTGPAGKTSTSRFKGFILGNVETIHGSSDMCENRGANTDIVCDPECPDDVICAALEAGEAKACQTGTTGSLWLLLLAAAGLKRRKA